MSQEIELKLTLPRKALPALRRHPLFAAAPKQGTTVTLDNTYFDTPDLRLHERRVALRTRRYGRKQVQTVKCAAESAGGLSQRPEWEQPFTEHFDFSAIDAPKVRKLLQRHTASLVPVFTTRFRRETRLYAPSEGVRILMMLDTGDIRAGDRHTPLCELELELVAGRPLDLLALARRLADDLPLFPEDVSKAQRGFALHRGETVTPLRTEPSRITPTHSPLEAFLTLAFSSLRQWQGNAAGAAGADDPEFLHQLRVALRRLRSLIDLFAPILPTDFVAAWEARLAENAARFAGLRDLDVLCDELLAPITRASYAQQGVESAALAYLTEHLLAAREALRRELAPHLAQPVQGRDLLALTEALHILPASPLVGSDNLPAFAATQLERLARKAARRLAAATADAPETLHALRIAIKRLRYALDCFAPLLPPKRLGRWLAQLTPAQDALGFIHDVDVARAHLAPPADADPEVRTAAAFLAGWHGPRYTRHGRRVLRDLAQLFDTRAPWQT